jgi:hypothetical protein
MDVWKCQLEKMQLCKDVTELLKRHGEPFRKEPGDGFEVWFYPMGADDSAIYSAHVIVRPNQTVTSYMHTQPIVGASNRRPWWKFWRR